MIHPANTQSLDFFTIRSEKESIYARDSVKTAHSKQFWNREARTVRPDKEACKIVTGSAKYSRRTQEWTKGQPLDLFGFWQTDSYQPSVCNTVVWLKFVF